MVCIHRSNNIRSILLWRCGVGVYETLRESVSSLLNGATYSALALAASLALKELASLDVTPTLVLALSI